MPRHKAGRYGEETNMKSLFSFVVLALSLVGDFARAQDAAVDEVAALKVAIEHLKKENAKLKEENQLLRRLVAGNSSADTTTETTSTETPKNKPQRGATPDSLTTGDAQETGYWLTTSSGKRHNSKCRYYKTSKGRPCKPDEGTACASSSESVGELRHG